MSKEALELSEVNRKFALGEITSSVFLREIAAVRIKHEQLRTRTVAQVLETLEQEDFSQLEPGQVPQL